MKEISGTEEYPKEMASDEVQEMFEELVKIKIPTCLSEGDNEVPFISGDELSQGYNSTYHYDDGTMSSNKILEELQHEAKKKKKQKKEEKRKKDITIQKKKEKKKKDKAQGEKDVESFASFVIKWP